MTHKIKALVIIWVSLAFYLHNTFVMLSLFSLMNILSVGLTCREACHPRSSMRWSRSRVKQDPIPTQNLGYLERRSRLSPQRRLWDKNPDTCTERMWPLPCALWGLLCQIGLAPRTRGMASSLLTLWLWWRAPHKANLVGIVWQPCRVCRYTCQDVDFSSSPREWALGDPALIHFRR